MVDHLEASLTLWIFKTYAESLLDKKVSQQVWCFERGRDVGLH
jgi:hypothetical protein